MSDTTLNLTQDFPPVGIDAWRAAVDKVLKGADFEKKLTTRLYDGITLRPIYTRENWPAEGDLSGFPGFLPYARGGAASGTVQGWDIRQAFAHPDLTRTNREVLTDLERGVTSVLLRFDEAGRAGMDGDDPLAADVAGRGGVMISTADDLDTALAGVLLEMAPVALDAGAGAFAAAAFLAEVWRKRGVGADEARGAYNIDPLGTLAATGYLSQGVEKALSDMADIAARTARDFPHVTAIGVSAAPYSAAGASDAQDLGCALATGVAYLRAMTEAGLDIDTACRQIAFSLPVGTDFFLSIAKLRAARMVWAKVASVCGASPEAARMILHVDTADRVLSQRDPWVNMLRVTVAAFAAGVAGADSVSSAPFTQALGIPNDFARRIARNTQIILQEESNLARIIDPAGGSWFVETLTTQLAERAWAEFQAIEGMGGMAEALTSGKLAETLDKAWGERRAAIARRKDQLTGINEFPNIAEKPVEVQTPDLGTLRKGAANRLRHVSRDAAIASVDDLFEAAKTTSLGGLTRALGGEAISIAPLPSHRLAEDFEALRDASDTMLVLEGQRPQVFLANMGRVAQHTARATYARNFFEAGGIEAVSNNGFTDPQAAAVAFADSGAKIACLCGSDDQYEEQGAAFASALKAAGAVTVTMAGRPGDKKADYDAAGVDTYIYVGCDALEMLRAVHATLGLGGEE